MSYHPIRSGQRLRVADRPCDVLTVAELPGGRELIVIRFEDTQESFCLAPKDLPWRFDKPLATLEEAADWSRSPKQGQTWKHVDSGAEFGIITSAVHASKGSHYVIYRDRATQKVHAMRAAEWFATDASGRPCHSLCL